MADTDPSGEISTARTLSAARNRVFRAFTEAGLLARWWGPAGFSNTFQEFDPRPGGMWRLTMHGPDGAEYPMTNQFLEVSPERVVVRHPQEGHDFTLTITMAEEGSGTRVEWRMRFDSPEEAERVRPFVTPANEQNLDRLATVLAGL
jgi:uncharacterized protein YndB with AHSA1/START domain